MTSPTATQTTNVTVNNAPGPTVGIDSPMHGSTVSDAFEVIVVGDGPAGLDEVRVTMGTLEGTADSLPASIRLDSTQLTDETWYEFRAKATDVHGKTDEAKIDLYVDN